jgi:hypothetical protein
VNNTQSGGLSRREMMKETGRIAAASALAGVALPYVHAGENNTIQVALVGCGGRGTGAAGNALSTPSGPTKLIAMADIFPERPNVSYRRIRRSFDKQVEVAEDRRFIGFDAYKKGM